jgi:hypothetical protein
MGVRLTLCQSWSLAAILVWPRLGQLLAEIQILLDQLLAEIRTLSGQLLVDARCSLKNRIGRVRPLLWSAGFASPGEVCGSADLCSCVGVSSIG